MGRPRTHYRHRLRLPWDLLSREVPGLYQAGGDLVQLHVGVGTGAVEDCEGLVRGDLVPLDQDALGLADEIPCCQGFAELFDFHGFGERHGGMRGHEQADVDGVSVSTQVGAAGRLSAVWQSSGITGECLRSQCYQLRHFDERQHQNLKSDSASTPARCISLELVLCAPQKGRGRISGSRGRSDRRTELPPE